MNDSGQIGQIGSKDTSKSKLILIVDDVPKNLQVLGNILKSEQYALAVAINGQQALEIAQEALPDLILLDIMMPDMDGFEVCSRLKQKEETKDIPVIFLSAKDNYEDVVKGFQSGGVDYVTKPFNRYELMARIKTHLELKTLQNEFRDANIAKQKLLSLISHDLRSGISRMRSFIRIIKKDLETLSPQDISGLLAEIEGKYESTYGYLTNILEWSKMQQMQIHPQSAWFKLQELVEETVVSLVETAKSKGVAIQTAVNHKMECYADRTMIGVVIHNLLANSIKYTHHGGLIEVNTDFKNGRCCFTIRDNGVGMNKQILNQIVQGELQSSEPGTDGEKGSGLGLALCKDFIQMNGGTFHIESMENQGTLIHFDLEARESK